MTPGERLDHWRNETTGQLDCWSTPGEVLDAVCELVDLAYCAGPLTAELARAAALEDLSVVPTLPAMDIVDIAFAQCRETVRAQWHRLTGEDLDADERSA